MFAFGERELELLVHQIYWKILDRSADPVGLEYFVRALKNGKSPFRLAAEIKNSPEAAERSRHNGTSGGASAPDGSLEEIVLRAVEQATKSLIRRFALLTKLDEPEPSALRPCQIMGTDRLLTAEAWREKALELPRGRTTQRPTRVPVAYGRPFTHSGRFDVTAIASLYKEGPFIERFLDNIVDQTIFDRSELIIIDACSPDRAAGVIAKYVERYPNIVYQRTNRRIGIYKAWNIAAKMARGAYLTSTNVDDLRAPDSFELQAAALDRHKFTDVIYQDFLYSLDPKLSFEEIESFCFKSSLPIVTPHNMLQFNSPHNAPMWRKSLHDELGFFDANFNSAADWEFWLRCLLNGKQFFKLNRPHVAYYYNPEGLSTRRDVRTAEEIDRIAAVYRDRLISPRLSMSRAGLAESIGLADDVAGSPYELVQLQLRKLGERYKATQRAPCPSVP
jgi:glycosyltransferase involved in cell wall biosynthesis